MQSRDWDILAFISSGESEKSVLLTDSSLCVSSAQPDSVVVPLEDLRHFPPCTSASHPWDSQILCSLPACSALVAAMLSQVGNYFGCVQEQQRSKCRPVLQCHDTDRDQFPSWSFINTPQLSACAERWVKFPTVGVLHVFAVWLWRWQECFPTDQRPFQRRRQGVKVFQGFAAGALEGEEAAESMCVPVELPHGPTSTALPVFQQGLNSRWLLA